MKNLSKALCFLLVFALLFTWLDNKFYSYDTSWEATDDWSQEFDIVFMGNSHVYCNINPVIVNDALNINSIVLASATQPAEITYYNLRSLLNKTTPKALVIEANILNTTVKKIYDTNKEGNLYKNNDGIRNPFERANLVLRLIPVDRWLEAYSALFRPMQTWTRLSKWNSRYKPYMVLGYRVLTGVFNKAVDLKTAEQHYREYTGTYQEQESVTLELSYLKKSLELAQKKHIPVFIIKSPISSYSKSNSDIMYELTRIADSYPAVSLVHDYNLDTSAIGLTQEDFYDGGHLNYLGAAKFTEYLTKDIGRWFGINPDFSKVGWFRGEHLEPLENGRFRYTVDLYDGCLIRFIAKNENKETIASTEYSKNNSIDLPILGSNCTLEFEIKAAGPESYTYDHPQKIEYILSPSDLKNFNTNNFSVTQEGNLLTVINTFDIVPVQYAWYVLKGNEVILKQMYTTENSNSFSYEFIDPGSYKVQAFIRTMDKTDARSIAAVNVTVDQEGVEWRIP